MRPLAKVGQQQQPRRRESTKEHWDCFWAEAHDLTLDNVYGTDGRVVRELERVMGLVGQRVLEVGAGSGRDSATLAARGARVTTLDLSPESLRLTQQALQQAHASGAMVAGDALTLPFADAAFDVVFHQGLLEHFRDPMPMLREHRRVLRPGGVLLVDVPQRYHYYTVAKHLLMAFGKWFAGWETEYSVQELRACVRDAGFVVDHSYGDWAVPSLPYRAVRKAFLKGLGMRLPMYPRLLPALRTWRERVRQRMRRSAWAQNTAFTIGVVARKVRPGL